MERKPDWLPGFPVQIYCNRSKFIVIAGLNLFHDAQIGEYFRVFISCGVIAVSLALYVWKEVAARRRAMERVSGEAR